MHLLKCWLRRGLIEENDPESRTFGIRVHPHINMCPLGQDFFAVSVSLYVKAPNLWTRNFQISFQSYLGRSLSTVGRNPSFGGQVAFEHMCV